MSRVPEDKDRFYKSVAVDVDGCWRWNGPRDIHGYGNYLPKFAKVQVQAHRWCYEDKIGPIRLGMELDHTCRNRDCVNPSHLEQVTHAENVKRGHEARAKRYIAIQHGKDLPLTVNISDGRAVWNEAMAKDGFTRISTWIKWVIGLYISGQLTRKENQ